MKTPIPWLRVFVEGVVIVGSILLAFGIDAWWGELQDERLEQEFVAGLVRDLEVDAEGWQRDARYLVLKQAGLDGALAWLRTQDHSAQSVDQFLEDLTQGARLAYGLGIIAERATFDELINTGRLHLLDPSIRVALLHYHRAVDEGRARLTARETQYSAKVYELIPRDPEFVVRDDLSASDRARISEDARSVGLEALIVAERNRGRLRQEIVASLSDRTASLLDLIRQEPD